MHTDILIVEDSATQAAQLEETLRGRGYETQTAANGSEALEVVRRFRPALILSDVSMPVMDGFQLCRAIKQDPDLRRIPVILLTSLSSPADVLSALEAGADYHIPKPYLADYLLEIAGELLAGGSDSGRTEPETVRTVTHDGVAYQISASPEHVLRLLLSTYEVAIQQNRDLLSAREELRSQNVILEKKVRERTADLMAEMADRERAEVALRGSEARYRAVAQSANLAIVTVDSAGNIVDWNPCAETMFGHTAAELLGQPLTLLMPEQYRELHFAGLRRVQSGGESHVIGRSVELEGRRKDSSEFPLELSLAKWTTGEGWFVTGMMADITERKRAEAQRERLAALVEATPDFIGIADPKTTRLQYVNQNGRRMCGIGEDEDVRKLKISDVHPAWMNTRLADVVWPAALRDGLWEGEAAFLHRDGREIPVSMAVLARKGANGDVDLFYTISRDITERKRLEAQFLQAQKMETVGRLAGGVAHDFNNLLTVINGTADLALTGLKEGAPLHTDLQDIRQAGERGALLTRQLLAFSRTQIMTLDVLNLSTLVADLQGMLQRLIGEHIALVVVPAKDLGSVMADPTQVEQVVMNLAVNARDAMPKGGTLTIETRNVELDEAFAAEHPSVQPGPHVMLAISDTGTGMDAATRAQIFEPFFTTKDPGKGTGLGLSTVHGIVKQSGWSIWVYSEPGKGATFKIYLPRVEGMGHKSQPAPVLTSVQGTETILVVEDEEAVRRLAKRVLQRAGYTVLTAGNGAEALLLLARHDGPVHLMLTDMVMPGMSGRDLVAQLEGINSRIKVLCTSGYTDEAILRHGLLDETAHFIGKPYNVTELTRKVREVLDL